MVGGFVCARCNQLYEERPESCHECGHEGLQTLTFSEFRQRRRAGREPWSESGRGRGRGRLRTAALVVLALGLVVVGLAAIGAGTMAMGVTVPF